MKKKTIAVFLVLSVMMIWFGSAFFKKTSVSPHEKAYIFDRNSGIKPGDIVLLQKGKTDKPETPQSMFLEALPENRLANSSTLRLFRFFDKEFVGNPEDMTGSYANLENLLAAFAPKEKIGQLIERYRKYVDCEKALADQEFPGLKSGDLETVVDTLREIQEFRRQKMGADLADGLFGAEIKSQEYSVRRGGIVNDNSMYGREKEVALQNLNLDMWGGEAEEIDKARPSFSRYNEHLKIYEKDLSEIKTEEERNNIIREFRNTYFSSEAVARMEAADEKARAEDKRENEYNQKEKLIMADDSLKPEEKKNALYHIQDEIFGEGAENFRTRLSLRSRHE